MQLTKKQRKTIKSNLIQISTYISILLVFVFMINTINNKKRPKKQIIETEFNHTFTINDSTIIYVNWVYSIKDQHNQKNTRKNIYSDSDLKIIYEYFDQFTINEIKILNENTKIKIPRYRCDTIIITNIKFITNN
jgi:hypothetical protein